VTSLIKHGGLHDGLAVLPLDLSAHALFPLEGPAASGAPAASAKTVSPIERELANLRQALQAAESEKEQAVALAREQGRKDAERAYQRNEANALAALEASLKQNAVIAQAHFEAIESTALALCETALAKVFANPKAYRALVTDAILRQADNIKRETMLGVHVSPADFPNPAALSELGQSVGAGRIAVHADSALASGTARIEVRLGQIELSIPGHWETLKATLRNLAERGTS
jgi:flagellar assembly protein FliH